MLLILPLGGCDLRGSQAAKSRAVISPLPSPSPSPSPLPPPLQFSTESAIKHNRLLAIDIGQRPGGSKGEKRAEQYIATTFATAGLDVVRGEAKRADGGTSYNVIARIPGVDYAAGYVVMGGHYDTVAVSPGGNDNGSGTAVVIALAEALSPRKVPVEFIAFAGEEVQPSTKEHHIGSRAYAAALADPSVIKAMFSVDMVANGPSVVVVTLLGATDSLRKELIDVGTTVGIPTRAATRGDISDHGPFSRLGIPSVMLWSGDHPTLHTSRDTFDVVQPEAVDRTGRLMVEWLKSRFSLT